jgi:rubrerythrin
MIRSIRVIAFLMVVTCAMAAGAVTTLQNLQTAYTGESNAHARYLAFAKKADAEGYAKAAALFRAAARAEQVHANNHAVVIKKMGGTPAAKIEAPTVKTTKENLDAAVKGETYEKDVMYPEFLKQARAEGNVDAIQTFNYARTAETGHAKLYTEAAADPEKMKAKGVTYGVCSVCGYTVPKVDFSKCPSCFSPKDKYETVS